MDNLHSSPHPRSFELAQEDKQKDITATDSNDEILIIRGGAPGYCSICCRPSNGGHLIGRYHGRVTLPSGQSILGYHYCIKYSPQVGGWDVEQPFRRDFLCFQAYSLKNPSRDPYFIICLDCMLILPRFFRSRADKAHRRGKDDICNPEVLYQHLRHQFLKSPDKQESAERLLWPHNGFVDEGVEWTKDVYTGRWITQPGYKWLEKEASQPIASLSTWFLSKLEPLTIDSMQKVSFLTTKSHTTPRRTQHIGICNLPAEIIMVIGSYLELPSIFSMRETCFYFSQCIELNQWFWYTRFIRYELFGFMFTHESQDVIEDIRAKTVKRGLLPKKMDWMRLIKQMSTFSSFVNEGCLHSAPPSFRNRRRVWKILETMETGDLDPSTA